MKPKQSHSKMVSASVLSLLLLSLTLRAAPAAEPQGKSPPSTKIRLAVPSPSLSYLPIHVALRRGFFAKRGFDLEVIQMAAGLTAPALLNRAIDYTTVPSGPATAAARGAPLKVISFTSVKLQHLLISRPEITSVADLTGKKIGAGSFGTLPAYEVRMIIEKFRLGPNTIIVPVNASIDRLMGIQRGTVDAAIVAAPLDIKAEEMGLKRLLHVGTVLPIPQAGLATSDEKIRTQRSEVIEILKATIEGLEYTILQREGTVDIIGRWMNLNPLQAAKAYESVRDTFSKQGIPSEEQSRAYMAMLGATAGLKSDVSPSSLFDFSLAAEASKDMPMRR